jgi:hypothetical protein
LEGYTVSSGTDNNVYGISGPFNATIICTPAPGGLTQVAFVVSADAGSSGDLAAELGKLQNRLKQSESDRDWDRKR